MSLSFARLATVIASTKRNPAPSSGRVTVAVISIATLKITPLMPVTPEVAQKYALKSPRDAYYAYTEGTPDILEGDILTVGSIDYRISAVGDWHTYREIIAEKVKVS
ncbi:MAG TPA: hypothetical protein VLH56_08940 [Dissulfurispiraceae bacterium]|nr:hypothetical protein [Dissulfurispiraceae bacterium]